MSLTRNGAEYSKFYHNGTEYTTGYRNGVTILEPTAQASFRLNRVSSSGTIHANCLFTADILDVHGQRYLWSERPAPNGPTGSHDDGDLEFTGPGTNTPAFLAVRRQRYSNTTGRLVISTSNNSGDDHAENYFTTGGGILNIFIYDSANDTVERLVLGQAAPSQSGSTWVGWRVSTGHTTLTSTQWEAIDAISDNQQFILTVTTGGDAVYT